MSFPAHSPLRSLPALLLSLLLLWGAAGCGPAPEPSAGPSPASGQLPPETASAVSETVSADEEPADADAAVLRYELTPLDYTPPDRAPEQPRSPVPAPRFRLDADGVWRERGSGTGPAVLMLTGDLMCQTRQQEAAKTETGYDFRGSFRYVKPVLAEADLVIGNLEATLSPQAPYMAEQPAVEGKPHLNAPAVFLEALRDAGFDLVVMSNNHNCDAGVRGVFDTLDRVEEYGLIHTGTFRGSREPRFALVELRGIRFGILSYATGFNGKDAHFSEAGRRILLNPYDPQTAAEDAAAARQAGAEYLLVYIHWGVEYSNTPSEKQRRIARELADAGFDCIVGSHPHALQPFETVEAGDGRRVPVIYSMGNFVSHQQKVVTKDTLILRLVFDRDAAGRVVLEAQGYIPCRVFKTFKEANYAVLPMTEPYKQGLRSGYFASALERIAEVVGPALPMLGTVE